MAVIGTFGSFTAARLGIYASQSSLNVTGNNIANINTTGYTRQRADLVSLYSYGTARYASNRNLNIGYGVLIDNVSQLRDPFLDIRYREENASMGAYEEKLNCLKQLAQVLDEVGRGTEDFGIVEAQFSDFLGQLQYLLGRVGAVEYDTTVRGSAQTLTQLLNSYSRAMDTLATNKLKELQDNVKTVNTLLTEIRDLSAQIREGEIAGDTCLEMRDERNLRIDELSAYLKIDVSYDREKIDEFNSVERINISIADSGNPPIKLIQGIYGAQISMPEMAAARNPAYNSDPAYGPSHYYISRESDLAHGKIVYTNNRREALTSGGQPVKNDRDSLEAAMTKLGYPKDNTGAFDATALNDFLNGLTDTYSDDAYSPYLDENGDPGAWFEKDAGLVENALKGSRDNRLWMTVEPLVDAKDRYLRDEYHKEITESVDLSDTQLYGSLQAIREFLTEKGEFSTMDDLAFDSKAAQKRGLPYYQNALDALARKFAEAFNKANRLDLDKVLEAYENDGDFFLDKNGLQMTALTDKNNNLITPDFFKALTEKMNRLEELKEQIAGGKLSTEQLEIEIDRLQAEKDSLSSTRQELLDEREQWMREREPLLQQREPLLTERQQLLERLEALDPETDAEEIADLNAQIETLNGKIGKLNEDIAPLDEKIGPLDEKIGPLDEKIPELADRIKVLEGQLASGDGTLTADQIAEKGQEIKDLEAEIAADSVTAYEYIEVLRTQGGQLTDKWSAYNGGVLFSNNGDTNDTTNINAGNITVSKGWTTGEVRILNTKKPSGLGNSTANDNIYHMIELMSEDMNYYPSEISDLLGAGLMNDGGNLYFTGSFQERLADMNSLLAVETHTTDLMYNEYATTTLSLENSRQSVAGVDLNDEATNMMVYQKAYAAACQLMTTLDSMLDKLINGTLR